MEIFDAYVEDLIRQDKAKDKKGAKSGSAQEEERKKPLQSDMQNDDVTRVAAAAKVMERMVNQNTFDDIAQGSHVVPHSWLFCLQLYPCHCASCCPLLLQTSSIMRTVVMTTGMAREACYHCGDSNTKKPRRPLSLLFAGTLSTMTCLL